VNAHNGQHHQEPTDVTLDQCPVDDIFAPDYRVHALDQTAKTCPGYVHTCTGVPGCMVAILDPVL